MMELFLCIVIFLLTYLIMMVSSKFFMYHLDVLDRKKRNKDLKYYKKLRSMPPSEQLTKELNLAIDKWHRDFNEPLF